MSNDINDLKEQMCEIGRRIWLRGFCAGNEGNHSVRVTSGGGPDRFLCTPTGLSKGFLTPDDIVVVDGEGNQVEENVNGRKRTSEVLVHLAIYRQRPDINAVIHSHPPHAVAFCIAGMPLPEGVHPEAEVFLGKVPVAPYATPGTSALPDSILPLINEETNTILMGNHGSVNFADTLTIAYYRLEILDNYCKQLLLARQLGNVNVLNANQMTELLKVKERFGFPDARLACSAQGCVGQDNAAFLTPFDVRPAGAACNCRSGGEVATHDQAALARNGAAASGSTNGNGMPAGDDAFEQMVQTITDQIVASLR